MLYLRVLRAKMQIGKFEKMNNQTVNAVAKPQLYSSLTRLVSPHAKLKRDDITVVDLHISLSFTIGDVQKLPDTMQRRAHTGTTLVRMPQPIFASP